jgi:hypothetical protein
MRHSAKTPIPKKRWGLGKVGIKTDTRMKKNPQMDELFKAVGELAKTRNRLARRAEREYALEVEALLKDQSRDSQRIEHLLDGILDFCFDSSMLYLYKKLCRYYFKINPEATAWYVYAYRDLWDEEESANGNENHRG